MPVGAAIGGGSIVSGLLGSRASGKAADAQADASAAGIAEQRRQFDTILGLTQPQRNVGNAALNVLAQAFIPGYQQGGGQGMRSQPMGVPQVSPNLLGGNAINSVLRQNTPYAYSPANGDNYLRTLMDNSGGTYGYADRMVPNEYESGQRAGARNMPNMPTQVGYVGGGGQNALTAGSLSEQFRNLPGAQFMVDEATGALQNGYAARGGALSGNALSAISDRAQNIASSTIFNGLGRLAGIGQVGTQSAVGAAQNQGNNISNLLAQQGAARASGIAGGAQSINNAIQGGLSNYLLYRNTGGGG